MGPSARRLRRLTYKRAITRWWAMLGIALLFIWAIAFVAGWRPSALPRSSLPPAAAEVVGFAPIVGLLVFSLSIGGHFLLLARTRRCPRCLYPVEGEGSPMPEVCTCPECGLMIRRDDYDEAFRGVHPKHRPPVESE